ncbi:uncharacterized protein DNG_07510 [Cephalotrichum gorgonifer]|uniref:CCHC-type domain-containing protein n=1 Tax=Cephalotrichum gorgonifer TaxID=2041049 RepID=A0AAE8N4S9_9PEZI|nr:uncharacterized protein DNG_07510 [Cephalotrichum gorgonifer]
MGVVCATPIAAINYLFRTPFHPDLILMDEAGRMSETELIVLIALFKGPWMAVGDKSQLGPYVRTDHAAGNADQSKNPYIQMSWRSTLERYSLASVSEAPELRFNFRAHGNLGDLPRTIIDGGRMATPRTNFCRWSPSVDAFHCFLRQIHPGIQERDTRLMVHFPGSWMRKSASQSCVNQTHVKWALSQVKLVLTSPTLTSISGDRACDVLVLPYYKEQPKMYQAQLLKMLETGDLNRDQFDRVKVSTLDSAQGAQADLCIVDLVRTDDPGFIGDVKRQCLTITRSVQAELILAGPGLFIGMEKNPRQAARAEILERLYNAILDVNGVVAIDTCQTCETPNPGHTNDKCPETDESVTYLPCNATPTCSSVGAVVRVGTAPAWDHWAYQCVNACGSCGGGDHETVDCPKQACQSCHKRGHHMKDCAGFSTCTLCGEIGHFRNACPNKNPEKTKAIADHIASQGFRHRGTGGGDGSGSGYNARRK